LSREINVIEAHGFEAPNAFEPVFLPGRRRAMDGKVIMPKTAAQIDRLVINQQLASIEPEPSQAESLFHFIPRLSIRRKPAQPGPVKVGMAIAPGLDGVDVGSPSHLLRLLESGDLDPALADQFVLAGV